MTNKPEAAWLIDWNGKLLHTVMTHCKDTSGMCYGDGFVWSGANGASVVNPPDPPINGVFQTDMNGKQISHRQIPFGPKNNGGATHGMSWQKDAAKIWIDVQSPADRSCGSIRRPGRSTTCSPRRAVRSRNGCTASPTTTGSSGR